jgi:hypothetical protein
MSFKRFCVAMIAAVAALSTLSDGKKLKSDIQALPGVQIRAE